MQIRSDQVEFGAASSLGCVAGVGCVNCRGWVGRVTTSQVALQAYGLSADSKKKLEDFSSFCHSAYQSGQKLNQKKDSPEKASCMCNLIYTYCPCAAPPCIHRKIRKPIFILDVWHDVYSYKPCLRPHV